MCPRERRRSRRTTLRFPVLDGFILRLIITKDVVATGKRLGENLTGASGALIQKEDQPDVAWLVLPCNASAELIHHESLHAVFALFRLHGCDLDDEEQLAYWTAHIASRVKKFMRRK